MIPPKANAAFVAALEDVLEVYTRPNDPAKPLVCLDETSKQLVAETRTPSPAQPGTTGALRLRNTSATVPPTCSCCLLSSKVGERSRSPSARTAIDYAQVLKELSDVHFARAEIVCVDKCIMLSTLNDPSIRYRARRFTIRGSSLI